MIAVADEVGDMPGASHALKSRRKNKTESQKLYEALSSNNLTWLQDTFGSKYDDENVGQDVGVSPRRRTRASRTLQENPPQLSMTTASMVFYDFKRLFTVCSIVCSVTRIS